MAPMLSFETQAGEPIQHGSVTLIPFARTWRILFPFQFPGGNLGFGLTWSRPASVLARTDDGQEQVIPVRDVTRQAQVGLLATCIGMMIFMLVVSGLRSKRTR